jgi:lipopolysaccharide/colanic/teichoic acid biosynthesis glycosyltransferase/glycosyltransferase involved in cell wall biosynthesis
MINENALVERNPTGPRIRILFAVTSALSWGFFGGIIGMLQDAGFDPVLVSSPGEQLQATAQRARVRCAAVPMNREISPRRDLVSLWRFFRLIQRVRPIITNVGTPKAGLLAGLAAWSLGVPCRIYTLHGLRLETTRGLKRALLIMMERIACACAHRVICVSPSLRRRAIELELVPFGKTVVLGSGSCCGVDVHRFSPAVRNSPEKNLLADHLGIQHGVPVIGFVGRLTCDKGIGELIPAFSNLRQSWPTLRLLLIGEFEDGDPLPAEIRDQIEVDQSIIRIGYVSDTAPYFRQMDVLVLPTHREGLGQVSLEAQACGVPVVTSTATGAIDTVVDGLTGFLVPVGSAYALTARIEELLQDPELRERMGQAGRERIVREFRQERVASALIEEHRRLIQDRTVPDTSARIHHRVTESRGGMGLANEMAHHNRQCGLPLKMKRIADLLVSFAILTAFLPVLFAIGILLLLAMGRPILFRQQRPGRYGRPFTLYKFRTMAEKRDAQSQLLPDGERLTRLGRVLRLSSLDELPQLWNVLRGDLSLVGPRPLLMQYLGRYDHEQARRHDVLPGITGWAQINGRNAITWNRKFELDLWYVDHWSFWLDIKILSLTTLTIIRRQGINQEGHTTMPEYQGMPAGDASETERL